MDSITNPPNFRSLPILFLILTLPTVLTDNDHKLIYNQCQNQSSHNVSHNSLLTTLFSQFVGRSSQSRFFETIVANDNTAISGKFQCRNDLSPDECTNCVSKFAQVSKQSCGETVPARIQLSGCYAHFQEDGDEDIYSRPDEILYRECSENKLRRSGFEEMKGAAFLALENGVMSGNGFCETTYESMHAVAQCARNLRACDCGECVNSAVQIVEEECRYSVSGEVYFDSCFVSFKYYGDGARGYLSEDNGIGHRSSKIVAIFVGGLAALFVGLGLCFLIRSCGKKKDDW